ncbi:MAG: hypothetical protein KDA22_08550 [Phycisphaerales bacterium]|nr:hypothetical protein [Phycisphaerales bacterium]
MADDAYDSVREKVETIFAELAGDRASMLDGGRFPAVIASAVTAALSGPEASEGEILHADQIAFHLVDWNADAAFLVALHLFPERFAPDEINAGIDLFLVHVPAHVLAAARLAGHSVQDESNDGDDHLAGSGRSPTSPT